MSFQQPPEKKRKLTDESEITETVSAKLEKKQATPAEETPKAKPAKKITFDLKTSSLFASLKDDDDPILCQVIGDPFDEDDKTCFFISYIEPSNNKKPGNKYQGADIIAGYDKNNFDAVELTLTRHRKSTVVIPWDTLNNIAQKNMIKICKGGNEEVELYSFYGGHNIIEKLIDEIANTMLKNRYCVIQHRYPVPDRPRHTGHAMDELLREYFQKIKVNADAAKHQTQEGTSPPKPR